MTKPSSGDILIDGVGFRTARQGGVESGVKYRDAGKVRQAASSGEDPLDIRQIVQRGDWD